LRKGRYRIWKKNGPERGITPRKCESTTLRMRKSRRIAKREEKWGGGKGGLKHILEGEAAEDYSGWTIVLPQNRREIRAGPK